ncbi:MAG: MCE family protein [Campylobacterales bacterium]|nr:MCE family protein [Campylobacterales bacterium]
MYSKVNYTLVGLFVVLFTVALTAFAFWLSKKGLGKEFKYYQTHIKESVGGLSIDSAVKLRGINVGSVSAMHIDHNDIQKVIVTLKINQDTPIKEDMITIIKSHGVTGLSYIEITEGSNDAKELLSKDGEMALIQNKPSLIESFSNNIDPITHSFKLAIDKFNQALSPNNLESFSQILANIETMTQKVITVEEQMNATLIAIEKSANKIDTVLNPDEINHSMAQLNLALQDYTLLAQNLNRTTKEFRYTINRGDYNFKDIIEPIKIDVKESAYSFQELLYYLQKLSRSPADIINRQQPKRFKE